MTAGADVGSVAGLVASTSLLMAAVDVWSPAPTGIVVIEVVVDDGVYCLGNGVYVKKLVATEDCAKTTLSLVTSISSVITE